MRTLVLTILIVAMCGFGHSAHAERRLAIVIGNSSYRSLPSLTNPVPDAHLIGDKLESVGFHVTRVDDANRMVLETSIRGFAREVAAHGRDTVAVVYYAGHGVQGDSQASYLVPVDAELTSKIDLGFDALPLDNLLAALEEARPSVAIVVLDACRGNLPSDSRGFTRGLGLTKDHPGLLIAFSTAPGKAAADGPGEHSPYARALADEIVKPGIEVEAMFKNVRIRVGEMTGGQQVPWENTRLTSSFYFVPASVPEPPLPNPPTPPSNAGSLMASAGPDPDIAYAQAVELDTLEGYDHLLKLFPNHPKKDLIQQLISRKEEEQLWRQAQSLSGQDQIDILNRLIEAFPNGIYAERARQRVTALQDPPQSQSPSPPTPPAVLRYPGMDAYGNDRGKWRSNVTSVDDCERICLADSGCAGYTYNTRYSVCIPKGRIGPLVAARDLAVTGIVIARQPTSEQPVPERIRLYRGMDAPGHDYPWIRDSSEDQCRLICLAETGCAGYTYNIRWSTCIPKHLIGPLQRSRDPAVTGVVESRE